MENETITVTLPGWAIDDARRLAAANGKTLDYVILYALMKMPLNVEVDSNNKPKD